MNPLNLEIKTFIRIPPEREELDVDQEYPGYIEMKGLEDEGVFNFEFGRSGGYPSGKVVFYVDGQPLHFNADVWELYPFWEDLMLELQPVDRSIEKSNVHVHYASDLISHQFTIRYFHHQDKVQLLFKNQDFHYTTDVLGEFTIIDFKKAILQGFLDFMWHTNLNFEIITHDSNEDEIEFERLREEEKGVSELYNCRYIFQQFMKEAYRQKSYNLDQLIQFDYDSEFRFSKLVYDLGD